MSMKEMMQNKQVGYKVSGSPAHIIKNINEDGEISAAMIHHYLKIEKFRHDMKSGKLFPNSSAAIS